MKTVRTMLYGDCEFSEWELELLHTPIMQRMYNIKQLGFTDKVYPDAIHSRFNHILGVAERADKITSGIIRSLKKDDAVQRKSFKYGLNKTISIEDLTLHVEERRCIIRLIGILHDITHIPFGHTLEDELKVFKVSHDEPMRQVDFFNILICELLYALIINHNPNPDPRLLDIILKNEINEEDINSLIENFKITIARIKEHYNNTNISEYQIFLLELESSMIALLHLDDLHSNKIEDPDSKQIRIDASKKLLVSRIIDNCKIDRNLSKPFDVFLDAFTLDIIGNTICADLLDYSKRDSFLAGLKLDYDDRIFRYFTLASNKATSGSSRFIQVCIQLFTKKFRSDVASEIVTILRNRYLLAERVLYHPAKCAAGAMLGCSVYMMGLDHASIEYYRMGDAVFLHTLETHSNYLHKYIKAIFEDKNNTQSIIEYLSLLTTTVDDPSLESARTLESLLKSSSEEFKFLFNQPTLVNALNKICFEEIKIIQNENSNIFIDETSVAKIHANLFGRTFAAKQLLWQVQSRQLYKKVFRVSKIDRNISEEIKKNLSDKFKDSNFRYAFERKIENEAGLPYGTLVIHCPKFQTSRKPADVLVYGSDPEKVMTFKSITEETDELISLSEYVKEASNLQTSYSNIWNLFFYAQNAQMHRWPFIETIIRKQLNDEFKTGEKIINSSDLNIELRREYGEPSKRLLSVIDYIRSENCDPKPMITTKFVEYVESEVYYKKNSESLLSAKNIVNQWCSILTTNETK